MARKRTSLSAVLGAATGPARRAPPAAAGPTAAAEPSPPVPVRRYKQLTVYLPPPVYEQLRRLAFDERTKMHRLLLEGLDRVFADRGLAPLHDLAGDEPE